MALVNFKKGPLANLPTTYAEGTFYVTTDEHALYLDVDGSTRIRIGDFQEVESLEALAQIPEAKRSTTALYYVKGINCLAKWNGSQFVQINPDTGATKFTVTGDGNAITNVSYDEASRTLTLTKGATYTTGTDVDNKISAAVGELGDGYDTVKKYVDAKTDGIASDEELTNLKGRVATVEGQITTINGEGDGSINKALADAKEYTDGKDTAMDTRVKALEGAKDGWDAAATDVAAIKADYLKAADKAELQGAIDEKADESDLTELAGKVGTLIGSDTGKSARAIAAEETAKIVAGADESYDTLKEIADWISSHKSDASAMNSAISALEAIVDGIGGDDEKPTVVAYVADAIAALKIGDYAKAADLTELASRVDDIEEDSHTHENSDVLDEITSEDVTGWDAAAEKAHEHSNAAALAEFATGDKAKLDTASTAAAQATTDIAAIKDGTDIDSFKDVEDALGELDDKYDEAGAASAAQTAAQNYTDTALTWGSF